MDLGFEQGTQTAGTRSADPPPWHRRHAVDALVVLVLVVLGTIARRGGLPDDGLWYDDAWVAAAASKAPLGDLFVVSTTHPGFTALLMAWSSVVSARSELMALPALLAGVATAPLLYLFLRRMRVDRAIAVALGVCIVVAPAHVQYSTRVKSYVFEVLVVLALAAIVGRLARASWGWTTVVLWVGGAVMLGTLSSLATLATAVAAIGLALHPAGDRLRRLVAVGAQGVIQAGYFAVVQGSFNSERLAEDWDVVYDGYIDLDGGPVAVVKRIVSHVSRVGAALVQDVPTVRVGLVLVAGLGLVVASLRGPREVMARYLLALLVVAFVGSLARVLPFGASNEQLLSPGSRATLWLFPSLLVGIAFAADGALRWVRGRSWPAVPLQLAFLGLAAVVAVRSFDPAVGYPLNGGRTANEYILTSLELDEPVIMFPVGTFPHAAEPGVPVAIEPAIETLNGYEAVITDPRVWVLGRPAWDESVEALSARVGDARRVVIHNGLPLFGDGQLPAVEAGLSSLGFERIDERVLGDTVGVQLWERG